MNFEKLLQIVGQEPVFKTSLLLAGATNPDAVRQQLTRWTQAGRLYQLRRGVYALVPPFQKTKPHPFVIANRLVNGAYVSLQSALAYHGLIPEYTPVTTSVTTGRPGHFETPLGVFDYRHIQRAWLRGYKRVEVSAEQFAFVATPEKALLDLIYLTPFADDHFFLTELRLQNLETLDVHALQELVHSSGRPKLVRAAKYLAVLAHSEAEEFETV